MEWKDVDWEVLHDLRNGFLNRTPGDYWHSRRELEHYDVAFAPRIAAKWRAVATEFAERKPKGDLHIFDWGCGTAIASRVLVEVLGRRVKKVSLWDRSALSVAFAKEKLAPLKVEVEGRLSGAPLKEPYWFVGSHVWNELPDREQHVFLEVLNRSEGFFWVEPGMPDLARAIVEARAMARNEFEILAPCPHQKSCGLLAPENADHWCHHFAEPDAEFFVSSNWAKFAKELNIDLRALPTSYLVGCRDSEKKPTASGRVIGRPRVYKGHAKGLVCRESGVVEERLRPEDSEKLKVFKETVFSRWVK